MFISVISLSWILLFTDSIIPAYALSFTSTTICSATNMITFQAGLFYHIVCSAGASASSSTWQVFNVSDNSLESTYTITSLHGSTSAPASLVSGNNGSVRGIVCDSTYCYFTWSQATTDQVQKWQISNGNPITYINDTSIGSTNALNVPIALSGAGSMIYIVAQCTATSNSLMFGITNAIPFVTAQTFGDCTTVQMGIQQAYLIVVGGTNKIGVQVQGSAGQNVFHIWDSLALTRTCATSFTSSLVSNVRGLVYLSTVNKFAFARDANDIVTTAMTSCTVVDTITSATLGTTSFIKGLDINTHNNEWYVYSNSAGTQGKVSVMTLSPTILTNTYSFLANGATMTSGYNMFTIDSLNKVFLIDSTTIGRMWQLDTASGGESPEGSGIGLDCSASNIVCSTFCETAGNEFLLRCRAEANGGFLPIGNNTNNFDPIGGTNDVIVAGFGLDNNDIKTNGVGYMLLGVSLLIANTLWLLVVFSMKGKGVHVDSPLFVSAIISFAVIFAFVLVGWSDPLFLIVGIVAMIAFAAPKIVNIIRGGGASGGSTE